MKIKDIAVQYHLDQESFSNYISQSSSIKTNFLGNAIDDGDVEKAVAGFKQYLDEKAAAEQREQDEKAAAEQRMIDEQRKKAEEEERHRKAIASMLITSGFNFDGYTIKRYSGYISGDDVIQIQKEKSFWTGSNKTDVGNELSKSLVKLRVQALKELKEAAYDLGCNAVIGVDFDYITLDPEVHNGQITQDLPYVFCVTANGNAVVIEKN